MNQGYQPQNDPFSETTHFGTLANAPADVRANFIRKTYVLFLAGILTAIIGGTICLRTPQLYLAVMNLLTSSPLLFVGIFLGSSILAQAVSRVEGLNYLALFGFTGLLGVLIAPVVAMYERSSPGIVGQAAFLTIVIFGAMTAYAFVSGKNFSFIGGFIFVGMIGIVAAGIANMLWFKSSDFSYWMAWGSLLMSSGYVLYRTSNMIHEYDERDYCSAALGLFISFFNIFMSLLRILGGRR